MRPNRICHVNVESSCFAVERSTQDVWATRRRHQGLVLFSIFFAAEVSLAQDTHWAVGGQTHIHPGQSIGILAGAIQAGGEAVGKGLTLIAAHGQIDLQAQAGPAQIAAKQTPELKAANGVVNIAAVPKVTLAVSGWASITIYDGIPQRYSLPAFSCTHGLLPLTAYPAPRCDVDQNVVLPKA
jgi:hypothetical protein